MLSSLMSNHEQYPNYQKDVATRHMKPLRTVLLKKEASVEGKWVTVPR
jgi:hypothetical protein